MENKYLALNFSNMNTVEIRIFQGTLKKDTVLSYLQFALAVTMFTKKFKWDHMTENNFVKYVYKHKKSYSKLIDLIEGKITWK